MIEISRRCVADCEKLEAKNHIIPSSPETFHNIIILVEEIEGIFVSIGGLERSVLLKVDFKVKSFFQEVILVLIGLIVEVRSNFFVTLFDLEKHFIIMNPCVHQCCSQLVLFLFQLYGMSI
jgi:hypothetical protein